MNEKHKKKTDINLKKLEDALKNIKARFQSNEIKHMKEIATPSFYVNGLYKAMSMGYNTFITRFEHPEELTLKDILKLADISNTDADLIFKIAIENAKKEHEKYDLSHLTEN
ncbi:hypothetical protein GCM10009120_27050 [Sphingobacterium siyangense subsp. cladoniae]|uniref:hypothetical protein n=1 Tax=Sphingobacterium siyangense TaxID=459529 RepID=UPI0031F9E53E